MESYLGQRTTATFHFRPTNHDRIGKILRDIVPKHSSGIDGISSAVVKALISDDLINALVIAINHSISNCIFPSQLKISKIVPLFKNKGKIWHFENWRPVALLPALFKIYEKELFNQICEYLLLNNLFCENQFGFRKNRSTDDAIMMFHDRCKQLLDQRQTPFAIFLDLSKAFDTIDHSLLIKKLAFYGFEDSALKLMTSYLSDRKQFVYIDSDTSSDTRGVGVGVPQGSCLGPLLFLIYVNDLPNSTDLLDSILFADDTSLFGAFSTISHDRNSDIALINQELDKVHIWLNVNKLSLNVSKTKYMIFNNCRFDPIPHPTEHLKINNQPITQVTEFDFLGVTIDNNFNWTAQTTKIAAKISRTIGVMKCVKRFAPPEVLKILYQSLILPHLHYGIGAWGSAHAKVFNIQKKAIRIMANSKMNAHTFPIFRENKLLTVEDIYKISCLKMHYRIENALSAPYFSTLRVVNHDTHTHNTRNRTLRFFEPKLKTHQDCFRFSLPKILADIPDSLLEGIFNVSIQTFKNKLKFFFIRKYPLVCLQYPCQPCGRLPLI